jgi:hypothetical protein
MPDAKNASQKAHLNSIRRYRRLLERRLTDIAGSYVQTPIAEEQLALPPVFEERAVQSVGVHALAATATRLH